MSDAETIVRMLASLPLFAGLAPQTLEAIVQACPVSSLEAGHQLIAENQAIPADLFVVLDGQACVIINGTEVARLTAGELAGEISSAGISPPVADVIAATDMRVLTIPHAVLGELAATDTGFKARLVQAAFSRIRG